MNEKKILNIFLRFVKVYKYWLFKIVLLKKLNFNVYFVILNNIVYYRYVICIKLVYLKDIINVDEINNFFI